MASLANSSGPCRSSFSRIAAVFLSRPGLPFAEALSGERIARVFTKHENLFGVGAVYSTAVMVWSFLGQVLRDGKEASCQSAVARVVTHSQQQGTTTPTADTGDYCRARAKLSEGALRELSCEVADEVEERADASWLWKGMRAMLIDGFTFTMPDTPKNQREYPQQKAQTPGVGLPIARVVTIVSLATACVFGAAIGPYSGKETGECALLRSVMNPLLRGALAVFDRCYCSFWMIALMLGQDTHVCARMHQRRHTDFRRGRCLGKFDHIIIWTRPQRPKWMSKAVYAMIPPTLELREIRYNIVEKGRRTRTMTVVTTLIDAEEYTKEEIAQLYGFRWNVELDIRSIKQSLNLAHVRCKSPEMVRRELWTTFLGYNLIRTTAAAAALLHGKQPRQLSFTSACQYVLSSWTSLSCGFTGHATPEAYCLVLLSQIATCEVADRPGRLEPHVLKRRLHGYRLMQAPRAVLRAELCNDPNNSV